MSTAKPSPVLLPKARDSHPLYSAPLLIHLAPFLSRSSLLSLSATSNTLRTRLLPYFFARPSPPSYWKGAVPMDHLVGEAYKWRVTSYIRSIIVYYRPNSKDFNLIWGSNAMRSVNSVQLITPTAVKKETQLTAGEVLAAHKSFWQSQVEFIRVGGAGVRWSMDNSCKGQLRAVRVLELRVDLVGEHDVDWCPPAHLRNNYTPLIKTWFDGLPMRAFALQEIKIHGAVSSWKRMLHSWDGDPFQTLLNLLEDGERVPMLRIVRIPLTDVAIGNKQEQFNRAQCFQLLWIARVMHATKGHGGWRLGNSSTCYGNGKYARERGEETEHEGCSCEGSGDESAVFLSTTDVDHLIVPISRRHNPDFPPPKLADFFEGKVHLTIPKNLHGGGKAAMAFRSELLGNNEAINLDVSQKHKWQWSVSKSTKCLSIILHGNADQTTAGIDTWKPFWRQVLSAGASSLVIQRARDTKVTFMPFFTPDTAPKVLQINPTTPGLEALRTLSVDLNLVPNRPTTPGICTCTGNERNLTWLSSCSRLQELRLEGWQACLMCWNQGKTLKAVVERLPKSLVTLKLCGNLIVLVLDLSLVGHEELIQVRARVAGMKDQWEKDIHSIGGERNMVIDYDGVRMFEFTH